MNCPDCECKEGELHLEMCDVERCPFCGCQIVACRCMARMNGYAEYPDELSTDECKSWNFKLEMQGRIPWDGEWPGTAECREYGFWCVPDKGQDGFQYLSCTEDVPGAMADLNQLYRSCVWDRGLKKFTQKPRKPTGMDEWRGY